MKKHLHTHIIFILFIGLFFILIGCDCDYYESLAKTDSDKTESSETHPIIGSWHYRPGPPEDLIHFHDDYTVTGYSHETGDTFTGTWSKTSSDKAVYNVYGSDGSSFLNPFYATVKGDEIYVEFSNGHFYYDRQ